MTLFEPSRPSDVTPGKLGWQAADQGERVVAYLLGELPGDLALQFEEQMERDAALRDLVIATSIDIAAIGDFDVELDEAPVLSPSSKATWFRSASRWTVFVPAVAAALLMVSSLWLGHDEKVPPVANTSFDEVPRLALAWSAARSEVVLPVDAMMEEEPEPASMDDWQDPTAPPEWMVAALAEMESEPRSGEVSDG